MSVPSGATLQEPPRAAPQMDREQAGSHRGQDVVVDAVADVCDLGCVDAGEPHQSGEERGIGLSHAKARRARDYVDGKARAARPGLERLALVPREPNRQAELPELMETGECVRIQILERVDDRVPRGRRALEAEMAPQLPVLLAALDRLAECSPDDLRADTRRAGHLPPVALLVDERLADVEEDDPDRHVSATPADARRSSVCWRRTDVAVRVVFFDVGETLIGGGVWREMARAAGVGPQVVWAALGGTIERREDTGSCGAISASSSCVGVVTLFAQQSCPAPTPGARID